MFRSRSPQAFLIIAASSSLIAILSLARCGYAESKDVVDLEGDTHHNPPSPTTDTSTAAPLVKTDTAKPAKATTQDRDAARQEAGAEKLKLRAGERVGDNPRGKAQVLGMSLQEGTHQRVKVVDVAMNSPAFDAGVMKGDEIIAFQGFRGDSYRSWIDGIRRLTTDTGAGLKIPVVVARNGKQATALIEVQPKPVPRTLVRTGGQLIPAGIGPAMPTPGGPSEVPAQAIAGGNGGNNVVIDNSGPFGEFFGGGQGASPNERAVANIVRIGAQHSPNAAPAPAVANPAAAAPASDNQTAAQNPPNPASGASVAPINGGARIGMAGFRDDPSGMVVMVDVGALPAGTYLVGIADPSVIGGAAVTGAAAADPNAQASPQTQASAGGTIPNAASPAPANVIPSKIAPPDPSSVAQQVYTAKDAVGPGQVGGVAGTLNQIGTITVDQSGTGRLQQRVESAQVRHVVGQAIVLYSQNSSLPTTVPENLKSTGAVATPQGVVDSAPPAGSQTTTDATTGQASTTSQTAAPQSATPGSQVPVAAGIIQLITDRRPPPATDPQTAQTPATPIGTTEQPAGATPAAGQNQVR